MMYRIPTERRMGMVGEDVSQLKAPPPEIPNFDM